MKDKPKAARATTGLKVDRFMASVRAEGGDSPHPASKAAARRPRTTAAVNRRLTEYLRIDRGHEA